MQNLLEVAKTTESFAFNTRGALELSRFSSPDLSGLKCSAFLRPIPKLDDISHYELALLSFSTSFF